MSFAHEELAFSNLLFSSLRFDNLSGEEAEFPDRPCVRALFQRAELPFDVTQRSGARIIGLWAAEHPAFTANERLFRRACLDVLMPFERERAPMRDPHSGDRSRPSFVDRV